MIKQRSYIRSLVFLSVSLVMLVFFMTLYHRTEAKFHREESGNDLRAYALFRDSINTLEASLSSLAISDGTDAAGLVSDIRSASITIENTLPSLGFDATIFPLCLGQCRGYAEYAASHGLDDKMRDDIKLLSRYIGEIGLTENITKADIEHILADYTALSYDGEGSVPMHSSTLSYIKNSLPVDRRTAEKTAKKLLGGEIELAYAVNTLSDIPSYIFHCKNALIELTQNGCYPVHILIDFTPGQGKLADEVLAERARAFADSVGYLDLELTDTKHDGGIFYATFGYVAGDMPRIIDLTASVTIGVTENKGRICYLDASGYLMWQGTDDDFAEVERDSVIIFDGTGKRRLCFEEGGRYLDALSGELIGSPRKK